MQQSVWKKWTFVNPTGTSFHNRSFTMCRVRVPVKLAVSEWRGMAGRRGLFLDAAPLQCEADRRTGGPGPGSPLHLLRGPGSGTAQPPSEQTAGVPSFCWRDLCPRALLGTFLFPQ